MKSGFEIQLNGFCNGWFLIILACFFLISCAPDPENIRTRYPQTLELVGGYFGGGEATSTWGGVQHFELFSSYIFLVTYERPRSNLVVLDASNSPELKKVTTHPVSNLHSETISDMYLNEELLFLSSETGLEIFDVTNPENPDSIGWYPHHSDRPTRVIAAGNYIYYFTVQNTNDPQNNQPESEDNLPNWYGIDPTWTILDISNPQEPSVVQEINGLAEPKAINENYIYASSWWQSNKKDLGSKLQIIDISDKANPILEVEQYITFYIDGIVIRDQIAYVGSGTSIILMDVTDPLMPEVLNSFGPVGSFSTIDVESNLLVGDFIWLIRFDFSDPFAKLEPIANIDEQELREFICSPNALPIFDSEEHQIASCPESYIYGYTISPDVTLNGDFIYIATENRGFMVFEIP